MSKPPDTPVTIPVEDTVARLLLALQIPPVADSDRYKTPPAHTEDDPRILSAKGNGYTVTIFVVITVPHPPVIV